MTWMPDANRLLNPWTQIGLGILGANRPGASFGQAVGTGGLLGLRNYQEMVQAQQMQQYRQAQMEAEQRALEQQQARGAAMQSALNAAGIDPNLPEWLQKSQYEQMNPDAVTREFGVGGQMVYDKTLGTTLPAQYAKDGGLWTIDDSGNPTKFNPNRHELVKPMQFLNLGNEFVGVQSVPGSRQVSPYLEPGETLSPNSPLDAFGRPRLEIRPKQSEMPRFRAEQTVAVEEAKSGVENESQLKQMRARLPRLHSLVNELSILGKKATYTKIGQVWDEAKRQVGADPGEGAVARAEYNAKLKNEILPLLRQTFGPQFTEKDRESLVETLGDPDASPREKDAVLKAFIKTKVEDLNTLERQVGVNSTPVSKPNGELSLDKQQRLRELEQKYGIK